MYIKIIEGDTISEVGVDVTCKIQKRTIHYSSHNYWRGNIFSSASSYFKIDIVISHIARITEYYIVKEQLSAASLIRGAV
jgi:hypothetical protein